MVRGDLRQGAAQRVAGDGHLRRVAEIAALLVGVLECATGQLQRVVGLQVAAHHHHAGIGEQAIAHDLVGAAVRHHDLVGVHALVDRALVTGEAVVDVLQNTVRVAIERDRLFLAGRVAAHPFVAVGIPGESGVVLAGKGHGRTSLAVNEAENSWSRSSARKRLGSCWPVAP